MRRTPQSSGDLQTITAGVTAIITVLAAMKDNSEVSPRLASGLCDPPSSNLDADEVKPLYTFVSLMTDFAADQFVVCPRWLVADSDGTSEG